MDRGPMLPAGADLVQVVTRPGRGRCVVAAADLLPGQTAFRAAPHVFLLERSLAETHCDFCFKSSESLKRCSACRQVFYCGAVCQASAWRSYHKMECTSVIRRSDDMFVDLRDSLVLVARTLLLVDAARKPDASAELKQKAADIDGMSFCWPVDSSHVCARMSPVIHQALSSHPFCPASHQDILKLLLKFDANNFGILDVRSLLPKGAGVYPAGALLNHDCFGNCAMVYEPQTHVQSVRTLRAIAKGEELCHSYCDPIHSTAHRQQHLLERYGFLCKCALCLDEVREAAKSAVLQSAKGNNSAVDALCRAEQLLRQALELPDTLEALETERRLTEEALALRRAHLGPHHVDLYAAQCRLLDVLVLQEQLGEAVPLLREIIETCELLYPPNHPVVAAKVAHLAKLSAVCCSRATEGSRKIVCVSHEDALSAFDKARAILNICFGPTDPRFVELVEMQRS